MYVSKKGGLILEVLLKNTGPISIDRVAEQLSISARSARYYLKEVKDVVEAAGGSMIIKPGVGILLSGNQDVRESLLLLGAESSFSAGECRDHIIYSLLYNTGTSTIQQFSDELCISRNEVSRILRLSEQWLHPFDIEIKRQPGSGIYALGDEMNLRQCMAYFSRHCASPPLFEISYSKTPMLRKDYLDQEWCRKLYRFYPRIPIWYIVEAMYQAETELSFHWEEENRKILLSQIMAMLQRRRMHNFLSAEDAGREVLPERLVEAAYLLKDYLERIPEIGILPREEAYYLAVCILSIAQQFDNGSAREESLSQKWYIFSSDVLEQIGDILGDDLTHDQTLQNSLAICLFAVYLRMKCHIFIHNPLLESIKKRYNGLFGACWAVNALFEKHFGIQLNDDEVCNITLLIGGATYWQRKMIRTIVVCAGGIGISRYAAAAVEDAVPEIRVVNICSQFDSPEKANADLALYIDVAAKGTNGIRISSKVDREDLTVIRNTVAAILHKRTQRYAAVGNQVSSFAEFLLLKYSSIHKNDILKDGCAQLQKKGFVTETFFPGVLEREYHSSTAIGNGIAIPHAINSRESVIKPGIGLIRLQNPILWRDEDEVNLIFILALRFDDVQGISRFFQQFYLLLRDPEQVEKIRHYQNVDEIAKLIGVTQNDA